MRKMNSEERAIMIREFVTFPEAATWSYVKSNKFGQDWYIESISEKH